MAKSTIFNFLVLVALSVSAGAQAARSTFSAESLYLSTVFSLCLPVVIFALSGRFRPIIYLLTLPIAGLTDWPQVLEIAESTLTTTLLVFGLENPFSAELIVVIPLLISAPFALELLSLKDHPTFRFIGMMCLLSVFFGIAGLLTPSLMLGKYHTEHENQYLLSLGRQIVESPNTVPIDVCASQGYSCIETSTTSQNFEHILFWQPADIVAAFKTRPTNGDFQYATTTHSRLLDVGEPYLANFVVVSLGNDIVFINDIDRQLNVKNRLKDTFYTIILILTLPLTLQSLVSISNLYRASLVINNPKLLLKQQ